MANILLISYFFPPHNATPCRRVYSWAKYLKELGHNVIILTADTPGDSIIKSFDADLSFLEIYRLKYFDVLRLLMEIFKPEDLLNNKSDASRKIKPRILFIEKILNIVNIYFSRRGILLGCTRFPTFFEAWFLKAYKTAKMIIEKHNIDVIITSSPPPTVNLVGLYLKLKFKNTLWIADYRDLWVDNPTHKGLFPFTIFEHFFEKKAIGKSDLIVVASEILKQKLEDKYKKADIFCIENGYDYSIARLQQPYFNSPRAMNAKKTIVYAGTLYDYRNNLTPLIQTIERYYLSFKDKLEIIFFGNYETKRILNKILDGHHNVKTIIGYGGFLSANNIFDRENQADALLFIERDKENDGVLTGKIFEYMMFRKPILCIGVDNVSYVGKFLDKTGLCLFCGDEISRIKDFLLKLLEGELKIIPNEEYITQFSRKKQVERLNCMLTDYLNKNITNRN